LFEEVSNCGCKEKESKESKEGQKVTTFQKCPLRKAVHV